MKNNVTKKQLKKVYFKIFDNCLKIAIERGEQYNKDGNMVGSYSEYGIDDICSIIKVKAIRCKNADTKIIAKELPDIINYSLEILRRLNEVCNS